VSATPGSAFHEWLAQLEADGFVRPWTGLGVLGEGGAFTPAPEGSTPRYIGIGGMGAIAEQLAGGLDIRQDCWVSPNGGIFTERGSADDGGGGWCVQESKKVQTRFDAVVVAHNGKCAERLTSKIEARDVHMLLRARFATAATGGGPGGGRMTLNSMYSLRLTSTQTQTQTQNPKPKPQPQSQPQPQPWPGTRFWSSCRWA
jgi:predicted NAD/FAD-dependent oxidoreductase